MIKKFIKNILGKKKFNSLQYWERRYASGGNSGDGSYGRLAEFKAVFINNLIKEKNIQSAVELGCGDGHQLSIIHYPTYIGLDVSATIIEQCKKKFETDKSKKFAVYQPGSATPDIDLQAELSLSLDVLYHIVEEKNYLQYLDDLFKLSEKYVVIYSTNFYKKETEHVLHRKFTDVAAQFSNWKMVQQTSNPYPGDNEQESMADFFVFEKVIKKM